MVSFARTFALLALLLTLACSPAAQQAPPRPLTIGIIGASDSVGIGASDPSKTGWVPVLQSMLPSGTRVVNAGIDGARVRTALEQELPVILDVQPDIVAIWISVNDINARTPIAQYERDMNTLLSELSTKTNARLVLANVPNLAALPLYGSVPPESATSISVQWNDVINRVASSYNVVMVDLSAPAYSQELLSNPSYISADGFHPSDDGYKRLAELFYDAFASAKLIPDSR